MSKQTAFMDVNLMELNKKKVPKRLLHFADGILEEYSSDEDELDNPKQNYQELVDPKTLSWIPYFGYLLYKLGSRTLSVCDYLGENLAWYLGITSPKFQYEIDECIKVAEEEKELEDRVKAENAGWTSYATSDKVVNIIANQPESLKSELV